MKLFDIAGGTVWQTIISLLVVNMKSFVEDSKSKIVGKITVSKKLRTKYVRSYYL